MRLCYTPEGFVSCAVDGSNTALASDHTKRTKYTMADRKGIWVQVGLGGNGCILNVVLWDSNGKRLFSKISNELQQGGENRVNRGRGKCMHLGL